VHACTFFKSLARPDEIFACFTVSVSSITINLRIAHDKGEFDVRHGSQQGVPPSWVRTRAEAADHPNCPKPIGGMQASYGDGTFRKKLETSAIPPMKTEDPAITVSIFFVSLFSFMGKAHRHISGTTLPPR
jgi:hypothetical protein